MRTLFHTPFDPASRLIRLVLAEKRVSARFVDAQNEDAEALTHFHPRPATPILIDETPSGRETAICPAWAIIEYLDEVYTHAPMLPGASGARAEVRRLIDWFCVHFDKDVAAVTRRVLINQQHSGRTSGDDTQFSDSAEAIVWHFDYLSWLLENRAWLAGDTLTAADFAGAAYLSVIDYLDLAPWTDFAAVREWYARLKSRPAFRAVLSERVEGRPPPAHYDNPDF